MGNLLKINLSVLAAARLHGHVGLPAQWGCTGCSACCKGRVWMLCPSRSPPQPQMASPAVRRPGHCWHVSGQVLHAASQPEDHRTSYLDVYYIQYSPGLKSVAEDPVMPKTVKLGHLSPSALAETVGSPWVWSTFYLHSTKQR